MKRKHIIGMALLCLFLSNFAIAEMRVEYAPVITIDGETIGTDALNSSPVILSVMAEWCPSCRAEAVELQKAYEVYKNEGIFFLSLFIRSSDKGIKKFIRRNGVTFSVGKDNGMARQLGVWSIPVTFLIAKDGKIKKRYFGRISQSAIKLGIEEIQK